MKNECEKSCNTKHIQGIKCDVKSCTYHDTENHCCAKEISVGPAQAESSGETACVTFKPKGCC